MPCQITGEDLMAIDISAVEEKVDEIEYIHHGVLTICVMKADNGFYVVGHSAPVDPSEYDREIGEHYAHKMAFDKLVGHEAYYQKESRFIEGMVDEMFSSDILDPNAPIPYDLPPAS
jgi:hypothetical protein